MDTTPVEWVVNGEKGELIHRWTAWWHFVLVGLFLTGQVVFIVGMAGAQALLFPDPRPLVERLGSDFFRRLPDEPGVYLMRDETDTVLYVGKAKSLRKRLGSYRVANPDRMPRRLLRLLGRARRIDWEICADETAALERESELLRSLRPKFNRAGVWPASPCYLAWRINGEGIEIALTEEPEEGWGKHGPIGGGAKPVRAMLVRMLWCGLHPERGLTGLPPGWFRGRMGNKVVIRSNGLPAARLEEAVLQLAGLTGGRAEVFSEWVWSRAPNDLSVCMRELMEEELESLEDFFGRAVQIE